MVREFLKGCCVLEQLGSRPAQGKCSLTTWGYALGWDCALGNKTLPRGKPLWCKVRGRVIFCEWEAQPREERGGN